MNAYLLIESRSDRESPEVASLRDLALRLRRDGHEVVLFLIQNAVFTTGADPRLEDLLAAGVEVWADDESTAARCGPVPPHPTGVRRCGMSELISRLMTPGVQPVWH